MPDEGPPSAPSPDALVFQAVTFRAAGADAKAIDLLKQALAVRPDHLNAQIQLGATYLDQGKTWPALDVLNGAARQAPESDIILRLKALCHLQRNAPLLAVEEAREAVRIDPNDAINHTVLGRTLRQRGDFVGAEAALRRGVELAPRSAYTLVHLGYFLVNRKRIKDAVVVADDAGRAAPDDFGVMLLRGDVALRLGRADEARDFALWALSQRATNRDAIRLLVSVKAHKSWLLGLWWRLNSSLVLRLLLVAAMLPLGPLWIIAPIYLIAGRIIFARMLEHELRSVRLKPDF